MIAGAADFGKTKEAGTWLEVRENKWIMLRISRGHDISGYFIFIPRQQKSLKRWCLISPKNTLLSEEAIKNKKKKREEKKNHSDSVLIQEAHLLEMLFVLLGAFCTLSFDQPVHLLLSAAPQTDEGCRNVSTYSSFRYKSLCVKCFVCSSYSGNTNGKEIRQQELVCNIF